MIDTTDGGGSSATARAERPHPWSGPIVVALRVLAVVVLLDLAFQVILAGLFITGDLAMLRMHSMNATIVLPALAVLAVVAGVLLRWPARGSLAPMIHAIALLVLLQAQSGAGYARQLAVHIPLGVAVVVLGAFFARQVFAYRHDPAALDAARALRRARRQPAAAEAEAR